MSMLEWLEVFVLICIGLMMLGCAGLAAVLMYCLAVSSKRSYERLSNMGSTSDRLDLDSPTDAEGCKMYPWRDLPNKGE